MYRGLEFLDLEKQSILASEEPLLIILRTTFNLGGHNCEFVAEEVFMKSVSQLDLSGS